jgi:hypothetical protein
MTAAWRSGDFIGDRRPVVRATVSHCHMQLSNYTLTSTYKRVAITNSNIATVTASGSIDPLHGERIAQTYADFMWSNASQPAPMEIPNIRSLSWTRSINSDVAEFTLVIKNSLPLGTGETAAPGEFEKPGTLWYSHGASRFSSRWKHTTNEWFGKLMPDNVIRTYEGYGTDGFDVAPEADSHLVQTGVWLIDKVQSNALTGDLTITGRDMGRLLLEQLVYAPVIPTRFMPLTFRNWDQKVRIGSTTVQKGRLKATPTHSSVEPWGISNVGGHSLAQAFDGDSSTYWLSIGNDRPSRRYAFEWVEARVHGTVSEVRFTPKKRGYKAYISLKVGGSWIGANTIPYHQDGIGINGADIKYHKSILVTSEHEHRVSFASVKNVTDVRITFGNLQYFPSPEPYHYRAGIRDVKVFGEAVVHGTKDVPLRVGPAGANPGRCSDFTDIIKLACAWAGFFYKTSGSVKWSNGTTHSAPLSSPDHAVLGHGVPGAVWGDLESTGTSPPLDIGAVGEFDKKTLMDVVTYVRNIVGYLFMIDESGAVQWRLPNIYNLGNVKTGLSATPGRTRRMVTIDEKTAISDLTAVIDSQNVREGIWTGDAAGKFAVIRPGWNPNPTGMRRLTGYTDQYFASLEESRMMADMIALRQLFQYRADRTEIAANPEVQVDDQVRIYESTTNEGYVHYVGGIESNHDVDAGRWTYILQTNWLGQDPESTWIFGFDGLSEPAQLHVRAALDSQGNFPSRMGA